MQNQDHRAVLRRVGAVLIVVGFLDIGFMIYCITNGLNYSSSLNIFAVVAGIFLYRGNLTAARIVTWFLAFLLSGLGLAFFIVFPLMQPLDLWATQFLLSPASVLSSLSIGLVSLSLLFWVYLQLRSESVLEARVAAGQSRAAPVRAFVSGVLIVVVVGALVHYLTLGESSEKAKQLAEAQVGPGYKFHVTAMHWSGSHGGATVTAYNEHEIKSVQVQW